MKKFWQTVWWKNTLIKTNQANIIEFKNFIIEKRSIWFWFYWLFILWVSKKDLENISKKDLKNILILEKALFLQIETYSLDWNISLDIDIKKGYYKKFITPYTIKIDLYNSEEDILSKMKPKWRYNINLSIKKWCISYDVDKTDENIEIFYNLMLETTLRDHFNWNSFSYYKEFLINNTNSSLIFTSYNNKIICAWIFVFSLEENIYYYGASTSDKEYRSIMAPYNMQFFAIKKAKEMWGKYYDFLWVADPSDKNSSLSWVTNFKEKFSSDIIKCSESYLLINNFFLYNIIVFLKKIKNLFKKYEKK